MGVIPSLLESGLRRWDISKYDASRDLKSACAKGLTHFWLWLSPWDQDVNKPELAEWRGHMQESWGCPASSLPLSYWPSARYVSESIRDLSVLVRPQLTTDRWLTPGKANQRTIQMTQSQVPDPQNYEQTSKFRSSRYGSVVNESNQDLWGCGFDPCPRSVG